MPGGWGSIDTCAARRHRGCARGAGLAAVSSPLRPVTARRGAAGRALPRWPRRSTISSPSSGASPPQGPPRPSSCARARTIGASSSRRSTGATPRTSLEASARAWSRGGAARGLRSPASLSRSALRSRSPPTTIRSARSAGGGRLAAREEQRAALVHELVHRPAGPQRCPSTPSSPEPGHGDRLPAPGPRRG
jgi:hypothetical protein